MTQTFALSVNGKTVTVTADPERPLLWVLREELRLTGSKFGCGLGQCGACTVHMDGAATRSCMVPVGTVGDARIATIEANSEDRIGAAVQNAWLELGVVQCGYCQSGQIMAAVALLRKTPAPSDADIDDAMTNLCRCGTYGRIRRAIHLAAAHLGTTGIA